MFTTPITILSSMVLVAAIGLSPLGGPAFAAEKGLRQPIFLLCPQNTGQSAWSLFFTVDDNDHSKIFSLGLERLLKQNSKDSSYSEVIAAQRDPNVKRELITELDAKDFAALQLDVAKDNALHVSLARQPDASMELMLSLRVSMSGRFTIGGKEAQAKRDLVVVYDPVRTLWLVKAKTLHDNMDVKVADAPGRVMSGLLFPVTGTGIYVVAGVWDNADWVMLMDRTEDPHGN